MLVVVVAVVARTCKSVNSVPSPSRVRWLKYTGIVSTTLRASEKHRGPRRRFLSVAALCAALAARDRVTTLAARDRDERYVRIIVVEFGLDFAAQRGHGARGAV
jgi:hypothetical protein